MGLDRLYDSNDGLVKRSPSLKFSSAFTLTDGHGDLVAVDMAGPAATLAPSGGDDRVALQTAIDAAATAGTELVLDGTYLVGAPGLLLRAGLKARSLRANKRFTISPHSSYAPAVASANDPTLALVTAAATIAGAGTTLSGIHRGGVAKITVVDATLLVGLAANSWIRIYSSRAQGGDMNGEGGAERYDVVQVREDYAGGNVIWLKHRLQCFHANGAVVRIVTTPMTGISVKGGRLDASGGSIPVLLSVVSATDNEFDFETRGASHASVHNRFGSMRNRFEQIDDGERNCAFMFESTHETYPKITSTGLGARFHQNGQIRGVVHIFERCNSVGLQPGSILRNGCTGLTEKGAVTGGLNGVKCDDMQLRERVARPKTMLITASAVSDLLTLFAKGASPNDTNEVRDGDRFMVVSTTTLPAPLAAQTVYQAINTTDTTIQVFNPATGGVIDITSTGGSFGEMVIAKRLVTVGAASVLGCKGHELRVGDEVRFEAVAPAPTGISNVSYYVRSVPTPDTFTISATQGGALQNVTNDGSGILSVERQRCVPSETFSRTGVVWVAAAGFECHGGGQPDGTRAERTMGFSISNCEFTNCYHPDRVGNQGTGLIVDVTAFYTSNVRIMNLGRTDLLSAPPGDEHMMGIIHWDNSLVTHNGLVVQGCEMALLKVGGWQRIVYNGCTLNGTDGQSNPIWAIVNGMESAAGSSQPTDVIFNDLHFAAYAVPIATHPSSWFAPTEYSWSRFRFTRIHMPGNGDSASTYEDVRCAKNVTGGALSGGDVVTLASITDSNGFKLPSVALTATTEPRGTGVIVPNPVTWLNNARCLVALGSAVATIEAADTPTPGQLLYTQTGGNKKLTTNSVGASTFAKGVCLGGKISNAAPFRACV